MLYFLCQTFQIILLQYKSNLITDLFINIKKNIGMSQNTQVKNYYDILGIPFDASTFDIENAYQKLATQWHPDKHKTDRLLAQKKFHDISEAYEILSDKNKRSHYNDMLQMQYSIEDANSTFQKFFGEHGIVDQEEQNFFNTHYPEQTKNYYRILGVPRDATIEDIKKAYRKLSLKYHPKNNPNNADAHKKFVDVNEAFNALSNEWKRRTYDDVLFNQIEPVRAHDIFEDFFGNRLYQLPQEQEFFKPILTKKWTKALDSMMDEQNNFGNIENGQAVKTSTVYNNNNGVETKKTVSTKKTVKNGKALQQTTEQYTFPTGAKQVTKTIKDGDKVTTKRYQIKKGEQLPKELTN